MGEAPVMIQGAGRNLATDLSSITQKLCDPG